MESSNCSCSECLRFNFSELHPADLGRAVAVPTTAPVPTPVSQFSRVVGSTKSYSPSKTGRVLSSSYQPNYQKQSNNALPLRIKTRRSQAVQRSSSRRDRYNGCHFERDTHTRHHHRYPVFRHPAIHSTCRPRSSVHHSSCPVHQRYICQSVGHGIDNVREVKRRRGDCMDGIQSFVTKIEEIFMGPVNAVRELIVGRREQTDRFNYCLMRPHHYNRHF